MKKLNVSYERYQRQLILKGFGEEGQQKLLQARVLVAGAGGLGCPALQYLAAAGIGTIGIVDHDTVAVHNLHRQVLFTTPDIGLKKVNVAAKRLKEMNEDVQIQEYPFQLTVQNALSIISEYDVVLDGTDNFATRYMINDACVLLEKPLVYGAVSQFEGQVAVFNAGENCITYRDLFPEPPRPGSIMNCAEAGVLGILPGIIGTMQAAEIIKLLTGLGKPLRNQLLTYDALSNESFVFDLTASEKTFSTVPTSAAEFEQMNYQWFCEGFMAGFEEIDKSAFNSLLQNENTVIIDVREEGEQPEVTEFTHEKMALSLLKRTLPPIQKDVVVLFCESGKRSREAAKILANTFGKEKVIYSLKGGILDWKANGNEA